MGLKKKVTTKDIADHVGLSQSAVSMILNNKSNVSFSESTKKKVFDAAKELGYQKKKKQTESKNKPLSKVILIICPFLSNHYYTTLIHSITERAHDTKDGTCVRDYIHVTDLAQAHILAVKYLMEGNESNIFNLGNGVGFTVKEVIETARKVTGKPIKAVEEGRRAGDPAVLIASSEKAKNILGWKPEHADLEEIIASAWKWHSSHPQGYCSVQKEDK